MASKQEISIARDFSLYPFGRYPKDGRYSGERFREEFLWPALQRAEQVVVDLDGVRGGYGSSFLEEVFGGLVRSHGLSAEEVLEHVEIRSNTDARMIDRIKGMIEMAASGSPKKHP